MIRFNAYTEALGPAEWNNYEGGELWRWAARHGLRCSCHQDNDTDPAYALINGTRVEIGQTVGIDPSDDAPDGAIGWPVIIEENKGRKA